VTRRERRPVWLPLLAAVIAFVLFAALGTWQVQRAAEKQELLAAIERGGRDAPIELPYADTALAEAEFRRVRAQGRFLTQRQFLLDNRLFDGRVGYDVITPLVLADGRTVLVDRGWLPAGPRREPRGEVAMEMAAPLTVTGRLWRPDPAIALGPAIAPSDGDWPRTVTRIDYEALGQALGRSLVPAVIRAERGSPWVLTPRPLEPQFGPQRHYGYAVQWFTLALTVLVVTGVLQWRRRRR
jgi:surfeit locus 1 family protein